MNAIEKLTSLASRFVALTTFGQAGVYQPQDDAAVELNVSFHEAFARMDPMGVDYTGTGPAAIVRTVDAPEAAPGDLLLVNAEVFEVSEAQAGAAGLKTLILLRREEQPFVTPGGAFITTADGRILFAAA